jgi:hypothetical protein
VAAMGELGPMRRWVVVEGRRSWRCYRNVDQGGLVLAALDALAIALYVEIDDFLEPRRGPGRPPKLSDAELITLAVCQVFLGLPNDRQSLALARCRLEHLFPVLIDQSGDNRRLRALAPQIARAINDLAFTSPSFCDNLRLLDSTPVPCAQSRETVRRSEFAGYAGPPRRRHLAQPQQRPTSTPTRHLRTLITHQPSSRSAARVSPRG